MRFEERARNFWACVSICFNQAIHWGAAPYPLTLSETCYLRQYKKRYSIGMWIIDTTFELFGEYRHCRNAWCKGMEQRRMYT